METQNNPIESISKKNADELRDLAKENGYDSIRFFIAPDKSNPSLDGTIQDVRAYFLAKKNGNKGIKEIFSV